MLLIRMPMPSPAQALGGSAAIPLCSPTSQPATIPIVVVMKQRTRQVFLFNPRPIPILPAVTGHRLATTKTSGR